MKQKLLQILLNQYVIAGVIALVIIYCLPDYFSKYKVEFVKQERIGRSNIVYYEDLNDDNKSEKIIAETNALGNACYLIYESNGDFIDQFNYTTQFPIKYKTLWFQDVNNNGFKEIYTVTQSKDSIFLNILEPLAPRGIDRKNIFIDIINEYNNDYKFSLGTVGKGYGSNILGNEVFFIINTGFSGSPRNAYKYDFVKDSIIKSPHLTNSVGISNIVDIDNDGKNEIIISSNTASNAIDSIYTKRTDYSTWLTVLDDDLSFLFKPIEFKCAGSILMRPFKIGQKTKLLGVFKSKKHSLIPSKLFIISASGTIEKEKILPKGLYTNVYKLSENRFSLNENTKGDQLIFNTNLEQKDAYKQEPFATIYYYDFDADGNNEWLLLNLDKKSVSLYRNDFCNQVTFKIPSSENVLLNFGLKQLSRTENQLYFQKGIYNYFFSYIENPMYLFRYLLYLGIYAIILGLVLLIVKGQKIKFEKQQAIAKEISELQIKTIKNQVDPHFVFNAINTISEMTLMDNKLEADTFICRFSDFMRDTLKHSDKISTTLKEELQYTENFIKLQQIRFNHKFKYSIKIDVKVDKKELVPKHVLFTYVENAIKHGLALTNNGTLDISVSKEKDGLFLIIEDNGVGIRETSEPKAHSTGNGLLIMKKIFSLYTKLTKRKITHHITNKKKVDCITSGVRIEIHISKPKQ